MPAFVAPEGFEAQEGFVASGAPELAGALEAALALPTGRFHRTTADRFARPLGRPVIHPGLMFVEVGHFAGHGFLRGARGQPGQGLVQLPDHFDRGFVLELAPQWFEPGLELRFVVAPQRPAHRDEVLHGVIKVQALFGLGPTVVGQPPNPHRAIPDDQHAGRLTQPAPQRFGVELFAQGVQALAGENVAALDDDGPAASGFPTVIEAEDRAGIDPVPAFGFVPAPPERGALSPSVALADVPGVQLILFRIQSNINNPLEAGEGLDWGGSGFELAEAAFQRPLDGVHRVVVVVAEGVAADFPPDQFLPITLWPVRRQPVQGEVLRSHQRLGPMPTRPVQEQQNVLVGMAAGDFRQIARHGRRVRVRQDEADEFAVVRTHAAKDMRVFPHPVGRHFRTATHRRPAAHRIAHPPEAGFLFKHQAQGLVRVSSRHGGHFGLEFF